MESKHYYLGLDIGTDSVGYAAVHECYKLRKFKGEPVWGTTLFETASLAEERRSARTARRRLDRRKQRAALLTEIFAPEICKLDSNFFLRRRESSLFAEDTQNGVKLFDGGITDEEYHALYPTVHHLICELMESCEIHDVRLVYIACAWLVTHRGHFLFETADGQSKTFDAVYSELCDYFCGECECALPWDEAVSAGVLLDIMTAQVGVKKKQAMFIERVYGGKKPSKKPDDNFPYSRDAIMTLLCGGKAAPKDVFANEEYAELESLSLSMDEENFSRTMGVLGEDGELLGKLRAMYDCALLTQTLGEHRYISEAKIEIYEQHKRDLAYLKHLVRKYVPKQYSTIFRAEGKDNYAAYSGNAKSCLLPQKVSHVSKEVFCDFLLKQLKGLTVEECDQADYEDMLERLRQNTFLPKQRDSDNRVIPQQLYYAELDRILDNALVYLPMLRQKDESGITNADKIRSIFRFRIPYYVGPLNSAAENSWLVRKSGKIYPWNFGDMVDLDASEEKFIRRMTNHCTYLPGEEVLPKNSLLYSRFTVLNEINNLTVNGRSIPVEIKQAIFTELFEKSSRKVTPKAICDFLASRGCLEPGDDLNGIDTTIKASLRPYHNFSRLLAKGVLTQPQVEEIILHAAYSEDKSRMDCWLKRTYPQLPEDDRRYILSLKLKEFGRLSASLLTGIYHTDPDTGEALSIMDMLWKTNNNLMQLLSERYDFRRQIELFSAEYYADHPQSLSERLDDMYISNAVKRPIIRTLKITEEVVRAMGCAPDKIFVEMARDSDGAKRGQRSVSRKQQILNLYKNIKTEQVRTLEAELLAMGDMADNRLQGDKLFLYYMQLGRCMYTGEPIDLSRLATNAYDIDHIYPQSKVQDDSILNNKVLCLSSANGKKSDRYPIDADIRERMRPWWDMLLKNGLIEKEKHFRLIRVSGFTEDELHRFINRQLVETRQSTKAVTQLLKERYPEAEIVYVKAGLVSRFRHEFGMVKSRAVNDLHHAKDAYLNIVAGNVYHERFTRRWFNVRQDYSLNTDTIFQNPVVVNGKTIWRGGEDIALVKKTMEKNAVHLTRYTFCRKGSLFNQQPKKAQSGLVPRKSNLPTEKYGGYNKTTASFYMLASYTIKGKKDIIFVPIELMYAERVMADKVFAAEYISAVISGINGGKPVEDVQLLLGGRKIKVNTVIEADGMRMVLKGKSNGGAIIIVSPCMPLILGAENERYVKRLESFAQKRRDGADIMPDKVHDHITPEKNIELYDTLCAKLTSSVFAKCPGNIAAAVTAGREKFAALTAEAQIVCLLSIISWFGNVQTCDLESIGGSKKTGAKVPNSRLAAWRKNYSDVRIVDTSASGLFESRSENLLELL